MMNHSHGITNPDITAAELFGVTDLATDKQMDQHFEKQCIEDAADRADVSANIDADGMLTIEVETGEQYITVKELIQRMGTFLKELESCTSR